MASLSLQKRKKKNILPNILKISFLVFVLLLTYLPLIIISLMSVDKDPTATTFSGFTFRWYKELFSDSELISIIIKNTVLVAVVSTVISTIFGTMAAIGIHSLSKKRRRQMIMLNNVPILNADIATGILLFIVFQVIGVILQIDESTRLNYFTLVLSHIFFSTPYVVLSVLPKLGEIDKNLYDAALDLGCKPRKAVLKVIIPAIKTGIFTGAMLAFTMSIDDFVISYMVGGTTQNFSTWFYARRKITKNFPVQKACAYNTLLTLITITCLIVYNIIKKKKERGTK